MVPFLFSRKYIPEIGEINKKKFVFPEGGRGRKHAWCYFTQREKRKEEK